MCPVRTDTHFYYCACNLDVALLVGASSFSHARQDLHLLWSPTGNYWNRYRIYASWLNSSVFSRLRQGYAGQAVCSVVELLLLGVPIKNNAVLLRVELWRQGHAASDSSSQAALRHTSQSRLWLLPSGPDQVHGATLQRTQPSTPPARQNRCHTEPSTEHSAPLIADCGSSLAGFRAPLAPHLARQVHITLNRPQEQAEDFHSISPFIPCARKYKEKAAETASV